MKKFFTAPTLWLLLLLTIALLALRRSEQERVRHASNVAALVSENQALYARLADSSYSLPRMRMTSGELSDYRPQLASEIANLGIRLRRVESLTHLATTLHLDTLIYTPAPLLSDSLCRLRWRDSWVSLSVDVRPSGSHIEFSSCDTLFQVVRRVPYRWWIFSFGTKAIRQEIRSSNPHTHLVYAEYIEIER